MNLYKIQINEQALNYIFKHSTNQSLRKPTSRALHPDTQMIPPIFQTDIYLVSLKPTPAVFTPTALLTFDFCGMAVRTICMAKLQMATIVQRLKNWKFPMDSTIHQSI